METGDRRLLRLCKLSAKTLWVRNVSKLEADSSRQSAFLELFNGSHIRTILEIKMKSPRMY